jgi:hypothetical protein
VTPMQAVSAGPRRASRSILPLTASSCLTHRLTADAVETRGCRADQNQRSVLRSGAVHAAGARRIGEPERGDLVHGTVIHAGGMGCPCAAGREPETSELSWRIRPCKKVRGPAWLNGENRLTSKFYGTGRRVLRATRSKVTASAPTQTTQLVTRTRSASPWSVLVNDETATRTKRNGQTTRAGTKTNLTLCQFGNTLNRCQRGEGVKASTERATPATMASVKPPGLLIWRWRVHPRLAALQGMSGNELPRASVEIASIHGACAATFPAPASAGRNPNTAKQNVPRPPAAKHAMGNHTWGAVAACRSLIVSLMGL